MLPNTPALKKSEDLNEQASSLAEQATGQIYPAEHLFFSNAHAIQLIAKKLNLKDSYALAKSSRLFKSALAAPLKRRTEPLKKLFLHMVCGEQKEAKDILEACSSIDELEDLLTTEKTITVTNYSSGPRHGNILKVAIQELDVDMCKMLRPYYLKLHNGEAIWQAQFQAVFPKGVDARVKTLKENTFDVTSIIELISKSSEEDIQAALDKKQNDTPLCKALNEFRRAFEEHVMNEDMLNPFHVDDAIVHLSRVPTGSKQPLLYWAQILGFMKSFLSSYFVQGYARGFPKTADQAVERSFISKYDDEVSLFPRRPNSGLGFDFLHGIILSSGGLAGQNDFRDYLEQNFRVLGTYAACTSTDTTPDHSQSAIGFQK